MPIYSNRYGSVETDRRCVPVDTLVREGPTPADAFSTNGGVSFELRSKYNIHKCDLSLGGPGSSRSNFGETRTIMFIPEVHPPELVVRTYLEVNPNVLDAGQQTLTAKFNNNNSALGDAWTEIADEYDIGNYGRSRISQRSTDPDP
jgi:hypothetical protein